MGGQQGYAFVCSNGGMRVLQLPPSPGTARRTSSTAVRAVLQCCRQGQQAAGLTIVERQAQLQCIWFVEGPGGHRGSIITRVWWGVPNPRSGHPWAPPLLRLLAEPPHLPPGMPLLPGTPPALRRTHKAHFQKDLSLAPNFWVTFHDFDFLLPTRPAGGRGGSGARPVGRGGQWGAGGCGVGSILLGHAAAFCGGHLAAPLQTRWACSLQPAAHQPPPFTPQSTVDYQPPFLPPPSLPSLPDLPSLTSPPCPPP